MRNQLFTCILLCGVIFSSCQRDTPVEEDLKSIDDYVGEYSVDYMDWNKYGARGVTTVDIDGDGHYSNDIMQETFRITDNSKWEKSIVTVKKYGKTGTLRVIVPVLDYYDVIGSDPVIPSPLFSFADIFLNISMNDDGILESDKFDRLDWPNDNRIGLKTFGGVQVTKSVYSHKIVLMIDHYLVYDYKTSKWIDGYLELGLYKE